MTNEIREQVSREQISGEQLSSESKCRGSTIHGILFFLDL
jgi:hypothetical protein